MGSLFLEASIMPFFIRNGLIFRHAGCKKTSIRIGSFAPAVAVKSAIFDDNQGYKPEQNSKFIQVHASGSAWISEPGFASL